MQHASPPPVPYRKPYDQRGGYWGRGRGCYLPRVATQGQYQQHGQYGGPTQQCGGRSLQPYQAPSKKYGRNSNCQGFHVPSTNVKRYNNWNYCHTHVFDVKDEHNRSNHHNPSWTTIGRQLVKIQWADQNEIKAKHIYPVKYRTRVLRSIDWQGQLHVRIMINIKSKKVHNTSLHPTKIHDSWYGLYWKLYPTIHRTK